MRTKYNVKVGKLEKKILEEFWLIRALKNSNVPFDQSKEIIKEVELEKEPSTQEIAQFLFETGADFVSVIKNYRFEVDLQFL